MTGHFQPFGDSRECLWSKTTSIGGHIDLVCARYTVHKPWVVDQYYALMSSRNFCAVRTRRRDQQAAAMLAAACPTTASLIIYVQYGGPRRVISGSAEG
jgi:hypothetical protein